MDVVVVVDVDVDVDADVAAVHEATLVREGLAKVARVI